MSRIVLLRSYGSSCKNMSGPLQLRESFRYRRVKLKADTFIPMSYRGPMIPAGGRHLGMSRLMAHFRQRADRAVTRRGMSYGIGRTTTLKTTIIGARDGRLRSHFLALMGCKSLTNGQFHWNEPIPLERKNTNSLSPGQRVNGFWSDLASVGIALRRGGRDCSRCKEISMNVSSWRGKRSKSKVRSARRNNPPVRCGGSHRFM